MFTSFFYVVSSLSFSVLNLSSLYDAFYTAISDPFDVTNPKYT